LISFILFFSFVVLAHPRLTLLLSSPPISVYLDNPTKFNEILRRELK